MNASDDGNNPWRNQHPWQNSPPESNPPQRKGKGRQKVPMEKIENETNLQVTFSKRRAGVFKKVSEISILCGAEAAVVVFSPGDKAHSFGHPDVETVANRFLNTNVPAASVDPLLVAHNEAIIRQRSQELIQVEAQLEQERRRRKDLEEARKAYRSQNVFPPRLEELSYEQLEQLKKSILGFRRDFEAKLKKVVTFDSTAPDPVPEPQGGMGTGVGVQWPGSSGLGMGPSNQFPLYDYGPSNPMGFGVGPGGSSSPFAPGPGGSSSPFLPGPGGSSSSFAPGPGGSSSSFAPGPGGSSSSFLPGSDGNIGNQGYMVQYPHMGGPGGSDYLVPYNYGLQAPAFNPMQDPGSQFPYYGNQGGLFPFGGGGDGATSSSNVGGGVFPYGGGGGGGDGGGGATSSSNVAGGSNDPTDTQFDFLNNFQGFNNNNYYGRKDY